MIEQLANLQPIFLLIILILTFGIENIRPYLARPIYRTKHDAHNFILSVINFIINGMLGVIVVMAIEWVADAHWGLLNLIPLSNTVRIIAGIFLIDFGSFAMHNLQHRVPFLWRFHRVHHSDPHLNSTSSLRFHPVDTVVAQCIAACLTVAIFGISMTSFIIYGTIALPLLVLQHSNVRLPDWFEKYGRLVLATPGWHKIHHSADRKETDSHYGDVFTFWDRIFGTWGHTQPHEVKRYGLEEFCREEQHKVWYLLISPIKNFKKKGANPTGDR